MNASPGPNRFPGPIRWGILGTGRIAGEFARGLRFVPGAHLGAVGSRTSASADSFARAFGVPRAHPSYEALVSDSGVEVVYVATPHSRHKADCLLALAAGKAVLCEKPFAVDAGEAEAIVREARQRKLFCMEAMWMRFIPAVRRAQKLIAQGAIGEPRMLSADFGAPTVFDAESRFFNAALGGGALLDRGVYALSLAQLLFGAPVEVLSAANMTATGVDEHTAVVLRHAGGQIASLTASLTGYGSNQAVVVGTQGRLTLHEPFFRPDRLTVTAATVVGADAPSASADSFKQRLKAQLKQNPLLRRARSFLTSGAGGQSVPFLGNGYAHEAEEVGRCLTAGLLESERMSLDDSVALMRTLDQVRQLWGGASSHASDSVAGR